MTRGATTRRAAAVAVALTAAVLVLDLAGPVDLGPVRGAAAAALGPLERGLGPRSDEASRLRAENVRLAGRLADTERRLAGAGDVRALLADPAVDGLPLVVGRVVAVGPAGPAGPERVTLDVGSRDGVEAGTTVVAAGCLVGRVVDVAPWTSDVLLVGAPDLTVGVRVGGRGVLGQAAPTAAPGGRPLGPGELSLSLVGSGTVAVGDAVTTLGSPGGRPFVPGVRVGTVSEVAPAAGRLTGTAVVAPALDPTVLDVVGVVVGAARTSPRPTATGGGG